MILGLLPHVKLIEFMVFFSIPSQSFAIVPNCSSQLFAIVPNNSPRTGRSLKLLTTNALRNLFTTVFQNSDKISAYFAVTEIY